MCRHCQAPPLDAPLIARMFLLVMPRGDCVQTSPVQKGTQLLLPVPCSGPHPKDEARKRAAEAGGANAQFGEFQTRAVRNQFDDEESRVGRAQRIDA